MPTRQPLVVLVQTGEVRSWFPPGTEGTIHTDSSALLDREGKRATILLVKVNVVSKMITCLENVQNKMEGIFIVVFLAFFNVT